MTYLILYMFNAISYFLSEMWVGIITAFLDGWNETYS